MKFGKWFWGGNNDKWNRGKEHDWSVAYAKPGTQSKSSDNEVDYSGQTITMDGRDGASIGNIVDWEVVPSNKGRPINAENKRNKNNTSWIHKQTVKSWERIQENRWDITISWDVNTNAQVQVKRWRIQVKWTNFWKLSAHKKYGSILLWSSLLKVSKTNLSNVSEGTKKKIENIESGDSRINMSGAQITLSGNNKNIMIGNKSYSSSDNSNWSLDIIAIGDVSIDYSNGFFMNGNSKHNLSDLNRFGVQIEEWIGWPVFLYKWQKIFISGNQLIVQGL